MDVFIGQNLSCISYFDKIFVEYTCCQEISSGRALERGANLNHPVHHFGSVLFGHIVPVDWILVRGLLLMVVRVVLELRLPQSILDNFLLLKTFLYILEVELEFLSLLLVFLDLLSELFEFFKLAI